MKNTINEISKKNGIVYSTAGNLETANFKNKKKFKEPLFYCQEISDHKSCWSGKTLLVLSKSILKPWSLVIKFLKKIVCKLEKLKSQNFKNCMFDAPVIVNIAFS